eukprot:TRINITY_DN74381_c0_g1_i1.p1 TRINITY_DN74381_c0_g1~~TRINITY_DN74381_c0_g1_i1.p1  ORF type:complete len:805 (-),score=121.59 TRINITY_DN74381_c0_g1_i1:29-2443(-)
MFGVPGSKVFFITALSGTGKTITGDYLAEYCGLYHVDGDNILHHGVTDRPEWKQVAGDITKALFEYWLKGEMCPVEMWHPYLDLLCSQIKEALKEHNQIVVTWVAYRREVREFLRERLGQGLRFIRLDCETNVLVKGALARLEEGLKMARISVEDWWTSEDPAMQNFGGERKYGKFSLESYKQMQLENALNGMVDFGSDERDAQVVDVTSRDTTAFLCVSTALGLRPTTEEVDIDKLKAISTTKMAKMYAEMPAPSAVSMAKHAKPRNAPPELWNALLTRERALDKSLIVVPAKRPRGPTTRELLESCQRPRVFIRVRPLLKHEVHSGAQHLEGLTVSTSLSVSARCDTAEEDKCKSSGHTGAQWVQAIEDSETRQPIGGFDGLFGVDADNCEVFAAAVEPVLPSVMEGSRVNLFCYGHTGTGKTHSMLGYRNEPGVFTQTAKCLLDKIRAINAGSQSPDGPLSLQVRFVELYLGKVFDLLDDRQECTLREDADGSLHIRAATDMQSDGRVLVRDQHSVQVSSSEDLEDILRKGLAQRAVGSSSSHDQSSRSHAHLEIEIVNSALVRAREAAMQAESLVHPAGKRKDELMVDLGLNGKLVEYSKNEVGKHQIIPKCDEDNASMTMEEWFALHEKLVSEAIQAIDDCKKLSADLQQAKDLEQMIVARGPTCLCAKVNLVDLAGNDFDKRDIGETHSMQQRNESNIINRDLLALKECISGIAVKGTKIPFRNSNLTRVLQKALLPSNHEGTTTLMLATVSPDAAAKVSTLNTLRYAQILTGRKEPHPSRPNAKSKASIQKPWEKTG